MSSEFPAAIRYEDLKRTHALYNPICKRTGVPVLTKHRDLYAGGAEFYERIDNYLVPRSFEETRQSFQAKPDGVDVQGQFKAPQPIPTAPPRPGARSAQYEKRKRRSAYAPIGAGMVDFMKAAIFQEEPSLLVDDKQKGDTDTETYWNRLNVDCDGHGNTLDSMLQEVLQGVFLDFRSYMCLIDPVQPKMEGDNLAAQKARKALDTKISYLCAREVGDWAYDAQGNLAWIRIDRCQFTRSVAWGKVDTEEHTWTYLTDKAIFEYYAKWKIGGTRGADGEPNDVTEIAITAETNGGKLHGKTYFGQPALPVIQIPVQSGLFLMDRLADIILAVFNRQSACTWSLDQMAFAILCIVSGMTKDQIGDMQFPDMSGIKLDLGSTAAFIAPDVAIHAAQVTDIDRLVAELSLVIQAMVLVAAAKDDQGRKSGISKKLDFSALTTLLAAYAAPVRKALERAVQIIKEHRDEAELPVAIEGLGGPGGNNFGTSTTESLLTMATAALPVKGIPLPAKKWTARQVGLKMTEDAPEDVRKDVIKAADALTEEDFEIPTATIGQAEPKPKKKEAAA